MPTKPHLFVANWKMQLSYTQAIDFGLTHKDALLELTNNPQVHLVICPPFPALHPLINLFQHTPIAIGAQTCSSFAQGAYTGEVSAQTLAQVGCRYCIVGHSERRTQFHETNQEIAQKVALLLTNDIHPILCIGENQKEYNDQKTKIILAQQLESVMRELQKVDLTTKPLCIAYEPSWAIGTGTPAPLPYLENTFAWLAEHMKNLYPTTPATLLYGGSVDETNSGQISKITAIDGFLIGKASTDFTKLKNIVSL